MRQFQDTFCSYSTIKTALGNVNIYRVQALENQGITNVSRLPFSIKILLESLLRNEGKYSITSQDIYNLASWQDSDKSFEIPFKPARVILQDSAGIPALVDLASLRQNLAKKQIDIQKVNPAIPVDLVIDHSLQVDHYASSHAFHKNLFEEYKRNKERYEFLRWAQQAFEQFRVIPPANGIIHQVNLEYLAQVVQIEKKDGNITLYPDSLVGTDSHTTMINGLGVLGWGVGGIEAEAVMLGQPTNMLIPDVVGVKLTGHLNKGVTATDLALTITQLLRQKNVVGKFVEFHGSGLNQLSLPDRATIANMAPEYGATMGFFPIDDETLNYLRLSGRKKDLVDLIERYAKEQGLFYTHTTPKPVYSDNIELDLSMIEASVSGPKRPQDRIPIHKVKQSFSSTLTLPRNKNGFGVKKQEMDQAHHASLDRQTVSLSHGSIVIASITSCTNTSNPVNMIGAGLLAKKAVEKGLNVPKYIKTSLAPGSKVVARYLHEAGLTPYLEKLGFFNIGYGCTTCVGNSGSLDERIEKTIRENRLVVSSVLSGNRNFEGRIHPEVKANYLASPPMVIAYALAGTVNIDLTQEPLGINDEGQEIFLRDIWPSRNEIQECIDKSITSDLFQQEYAHIFEGDANWKNLKMITGKLYDWQDTSTYFKPSPFFGIDQKIESERTIDRARVLLALGDSVTTDHISPVGMISESSAAGKYLSEQGVSLANFNTYGSRRGNHEVLIRGTFSNPRLKNLFVEKEGSYTIHHPSGEYMSIFNAAERYKEEKTPLIILAGKEYGTGSARDWAAKGTYLLGVKAVIAESFERIHRSNLAMMGVLPLQFLNGDGYINLGLTGEEHFTIKGLDKGLKSRQKIEVVATQSNGYQVTFQVLLRLDTQTEIEYFEQGGMFQKIVHQYQ